MYKSFPAAISGRGQTLTGVARQIAMPHESAPQRFPSFPALERTAVMAFNAPFTWTTSTTVDYKVMLTRQASFPLWTTTIPTENYRYSVCYGSTSSGTGGWLCNEAIRYQATAATAASTFNPGATGATTLGTGIPYGVDSACGPLPFVWMPAGYFLNVYTGTATAADTTFKVELEAWTSPGEFRSILTTSDVVVGAGLRSGVLGISNPSGVWVRVRGVSVDMTTTSVNVALTFIANGSSYTYTAGAADMGTFSNLTTPNAPLFMPAVISPEVGNSQLPWLSTRLTAVGVLFTNVTQVVNKAGTVLCGRLNPCSVNPFTATTAAISGLHPAEKQLLGLENGAYTFCPPSTDLVLFTDYIISDGGGAVPALSYRLDNSSLVNVMFFSSPVVETLAVNLDWHIEFRTTSTLFQIGLSTLTIEQLHQAQLALVSAGFFYPNSTHKAALKSAVSGIGSYLKKHGPGFARSLPGPAGMAAKAVSLVLSRRQPTAKATTATASGLASGAATRMKRSSTRKPKKKARSASKRRA